MLVTVQLLIITQRTILLHLISLTVPLPAMRSRVQVLFLPSESVPLSLLPPLTTMASSIATLIINTQLLNSTSASTLFLSLRALTVVLNVPYYLLSLLICILFDQYFLSTASYPVFCFFISVILNHSFPLKTGNCPTNVEAILLKYVKVFM